MHTDSVSANRSGMFSSPCIRKRARERERGRGSTRAAEAGILDDLAKGERVRKREIEAERIEA